MTLRTRIAFIAAAAVAIAVLATSVGVYLATAQTLNQSTDRELDRIATEVGRAATAPRGARVGRFGGAGGFLQILGPHGRPVGGLGTQVPVTERARKAAGDPTARDFHETMDTTDGVVLRVLTIPTDNGALQVALPIDDTVEALGDLRRRLALGSMLGIALAAAMGTVVARRAVRPVHDLTELAESVASTHDLSRRIDAEGQDEIGRLAATFNTMLGNLEQARHAQQQLVADASHELRTPLTSLRTNIEVLAHGDRLTADARRDLISDVVAQLGEFGRLVDGLVELARGDQPALAATPVQLDEVVEAAVQRVQTFAPDREFRSDLSPTTVVVEADRLGRAVANMLDNAVKYGSGPIDVVVRDGAVRVTDHGPGFDTGDLPHVFDRFYRSPRARSAPGSGLGLSIVDQVARSHGGRATAANALDGGAVVTLELPMAAAS